MMTRSGTPICGAARPAPSSASIVSSMSVSKVSSVCVPNPSISLERTSKRGSPSLRTGLIAIVDLQATQHLTDLKHRLLEHLADLGEHDPALARAASSRPIHHDRERRVRDPQLARKNRLR